MSNFSKVIVFLICAIAIVLILGQLAQWSKWNHQWDDCQGAQKRVEDTFKVMDACQKLIGCTITVDDLRKAQEQINQAESCK